MPWDPVLKLFLLKRIFSDPVNSAQNSLKNAQDGTNANVEEKPLYPKLTLTLAMRRAMENFGNT